MKQTTHNSLKILGRDSKLRIRMRIDKKSHNQNEQEAKEKKKQKIAPEHIYIFVFDDLGDDFRSKTKNWHTSVYDEVSKKNTVFAIDKDLIFHTNFYYYGLIWLPIIRCGLNTTNAIPPFN